MDMNYDILSYDELPADEAAMLKADAEEAERGYTDEQLSEALNPRPSPSRGQHPCLQRDPRPSGRRTRREAGTVHAQTPHEPQQCGAHAPRQGAGRDLILRPKAGPPSRGGGPAVFPTYVIRPMSVFLGVPRTKWQPLVDGRDGRSRTRRARRRTRPYAGTRTS